MSDGWLVVTVVGVATIGIKAAGPVLLGGRELPPRALGVIGLLAPALLAALVATLTFASGNALAVDARAMGVAAGGAAILLRAPVLVVVVVAAAVAAVARLAGIA